jgi:non-canonical poly(A) RNA polymerase PAPD5/7
MHPKIRLGEINPSENLGVLLVEFFELYGFLFNYNLTGISINNGGSYFLKIQRGWYDMTKPWLLSIVDPTDDSMYIRFRNPLLTVDVANDVSRGSFQMLRLRQTLGGAALILRTRLLAVSEYIRSMEGGYFFNLGKQSGPIQTVLGNLIAMSPEVDFSSH